MRLLDELLSALELDVNRARLEARENRDTRSLNAIDGYLSQQFGSSITAEPSGTPRQVIKVNEYGDIID